MIKRSYLVTGEMIIPGKVKQLFYSTATSNSWFECPVDVLRYVVADMAESIGCETQYLHIVSMNRI